MPVPVIAFFNNKGGVGKTSLVYHLAWMFSELGTRVLAVDLDPQANLSAAFLEEDTLGELWTGDGGRRTVYGAVRPLQKGTGDLAEPDVEQIDGGPALLVGDLLLSGFEDELSTEWPRCMDRNERAFRITSAFSRAIQRAAATAKSEFALVDLGPNLGATNRAALISCDHVVIPLSPDLFSLQGLSNLGPALRRWRLEWKERQSRNPIADLELPKGGVEPLGYVVLQHSVRLDRPVKAYEKWIARIPQEYRSSVLHAPEDDTVSVANDPHCLALLKHYRSLMPMAQEARKPVFLLRTADGALGAHQAAVLQSYQDFRDLARSIAKQAGLSIAF